jgi:type IV pilus assembly protein PilC
MAVIWWVQKRWFFENIYMKMNAPSSENKVVFFRLLAVTQKAGLWVRDSLESIMKSESHPWVIKIIKDILEQINEWKWLADALSKYDNFFQPSEIELIRSSEQMGNLPDTLNNMAIELEKFELIKKKLKSALMYPVMILLIAIWGIVILLVKVIPSILTIFPPGLPLPDITLYVMHTSDFLKEHYMELIVLLVAIPILHKVLYAKVLPYKIIVDKIMLKMPVIWPLVMTFYRYRFSKLLWDFYLAWLSPLVSFQQIANIFQNYHYRQKILDVKKDLEVWLAMTESFEWSWLFNPILIQIIWIWEKAGNVWEILDQMAVFYRDEVDTKVEWLSKLIEPILMVFVSSIVWVIVASIFMPMANLIWAMSSW